ncbi:MAG TPA: hypothetical protein VF482_09685 [Trebonia sp.]
MTGTQAFARVAATLAGAVLLLAGTLWGSDDHFPFGPFRMYAGVNLPDAPAPDPRAEATDATGAVVPLDQRTTGIRRAEIEGQIDRFAAQPSLLRELALAYARRHPRAPELVEVRLVQRWHEIRASRVTGRWQDEVIARWRPP